MATININKREVIKTKRNGRANESKSIFSSYSTSGISTIDWAEIAPDLVTINRDLKVTGNITATEDVVAYVAGAVATNVLDVLSVSAPLEKTGTNIQLNVNPAQFNFTGNTLNYIGSGGGTGIVNWSDVQNKPVFATVSTSGSYNDLSNKPALISTIAALTDVSSYFTGNKALTAVIADSANAVTWTNVSSKPATYTPAAHTLASHSDVSSYFTGTKALTSVVADSANAITWTNVSSKPSTFAPSAHTLASHSDIDSYFTGTKALTASVADTANGVTWTNVSSKPSTFTPETHIHLISDVTGLQTALDAKVNSASPTFTGTLTAANLSVTGGATVTNSVTCSSMVLTNTDADLFKNNTTGQIRIAGGTSASSATGAVIQAFGNDYSNVIYKGQLRLIAGKGDALTNFGSISLNTVNTTFVNTERLKINGGVAIATAAFTNCNVSVSGSIVAGDEITAFSDKRLKSNIQPLKVRGDLNPVAFTKEGKASIGFIAQEVKEVYPELVVGDESKEMLSLNYQQLTAVLYAEILELKERVKKLEGEKSNG